MIRQLPFRVRRWRVLLPAAVVAAVCLPCAPAARAQGFVASADGVLDPTFGVGGRVITNVGPRDGATAIAIQTDGKILAAGTTSTPLGESDFLLGRYLSNGALDTTFGNGGLVRTEFGITSEYATAIAIQPDGRIIVVGGVIDGAGVDFGIARYLSDGTLDPDFGTNGLVVTDFDGADDSAAAVALQANGKIVVVGSAEQAGPSGLLPDFAVARYHEDGSLDASFDGDGKATTAILSWGDRARAVAVQADGRIVLAGFANIDATPTGSRFALVRYNGDGSLDESFDGDGRVATQTSGSFAVLTSIALQADGKIVVGGFADTSKKMMNVAVARYGVDGSLDSSFGAGGLVLTSFPAWAYASSVAIAADGKIVAAGRHYDGSGLSDFALMRYSVYGALDTTFGAGGVVSTDFGGTHDAINGLALQADGRIVVAGETGDLSLIVARYDNKSRTSTPRQPWTIAAAPDRGVSGQQVRVP